MKRRKHRLLRLAQIQLRRLGPRRLVPMAAAVVVLTLLLAFALPSCNQPTSVSGPSVVPLGGPSVPSVRVRLSPRPTDSALLGTTLGYQLAIDGKCTNGSSQALVQIAFSRSGGQWHFAGQSVAGQVLELQPTPGSIVRLGPKMYRGTMRLVASDSDHFQIINHLDMESYLAGVLSRELRQTWSLETYKALAIAARTFARYQSMTAGAGNVYDVTDDQASQVYGGYSDETAKSRAAVTATRGVMLTCYSGGKWGLFLTQYSACCGGVVNGAAVIRNVPADLTPMAGGQVCQDCANCTRYRWEPVRIAKAEVYRAVLATYPSAGALGGLADIRVASRTSYGRQWWLDIVGTSGAAPLRLRADDLRLCLLRAHSPGATNLYSMNCQIRCVGETVEFYDGRGFGHGVGLCQWGAEGKAARGFSAQQILTFYYPGAKMVQAY